MKRIFFIRHAKSSWANLEQKDINRPLNARGKRDAPFMSGKLAELVQEVDLMICSPARRAQDTSAFFMDKIGSKRSIIQDDVYHASRYTLLEVIASIDKSVDTALIFGHNPGFTSVFNHFSDHLLDNLPTCGIFEIFSETKWKNMNDKNSNVRNLIYPKMYK